MAKAKVPNPRDDLIEGKAIALFVEIYTEYRRKYKKPTSSALHMINDIAMLEELKQNCRDAISRSGVMVEWQNGANQGGEREHPLISKLNQTTEQQRKLLNELKLTPASCKLISAPGKTGGDEFEAF